jgi:hypothetical protein
VALGSGRLRLPAAGVLRIVVNRAPLFDPSLSLRKLLGVYVAAFAVVGSFWGVRSMADLRQIPPTRGLGIALIVLGGIIVQLAP